MSNFFNVVCTSKEMEPDFIFGKIYKAKHDARDGDNTLIRVYNEFNDDYLYSKEHFAQIEVSEQLNQVLFEEAQTVV